MTVEQDDQKIYDEVDAAFGNVHAYQDAEAVVARGRLLRRRRRAVPALVTACVVAAASGLGLAVVGGPASDPVAGPTIRARVVPIDVDNAAFSVRTDLKTGFVTITVHGLDDPDELRKVLADGGIASYFYVATVTRVPGKNFCDWIGAKEENSRSVIVTADIQAGTFTIDPAKMPPGSALGYQSITFKAAKSSPGDPGAGGAGKLALLSAEPTGCVY